MKRLLSLKMFVIGSIAAVGLLLTAYCVYNAVRVSTAVAVHAEVDYVDLIKTQKHSGGSATGFFDLTYRYEYDGYQSPAIVRTSEPIAFDSAQTHPEIWLNTVKADRTMKIFVEPHRPERHFIENQTSAGGWLIGGAVALGVGTLFSVVIAAVWGKGGWD